MTTLTETEIRALNEALDDEYRAFATYEQVLADFGEVQPFNNILEAEGRHIEALLTLFARYGLSVPENPWPGNVDSYASLQAACEAGVVAEIANAEIYQRLLQSTERPDTSRCSAICMTPLSSVICRHFNAVRKVPRVVAGIAAAEGDTAGIEVAMNNITEYRLRRPWCHA